jgi:alkanesulfonate monooxygenase SsuD/methylene tetrahydromethanopterin reductase-like flavin-dependent oxidoreductase (luciferase family)
VPSPSRRSGSPTLHGTSTTNTGAGQPRSGRPALEIVLPARHLPADGVLRSASLAEKSGWGGVWLSEVLELDALVLLGALSRTTSTVRLGAAIVPVSTRSAALLAMAASTLGQLAPGRISVGLGVSTPAITASRHDRPVPNPVKYTEGVLTVVTAALRGETVSHAALPAVTNLRIDAPPDPPDILLAALGERLTRLAVEKTNGLILNLVPPDAAAKVAAQAKEAARGPFEVMLTQRMCLDPTDEDLSAVRQEIASYCRVEVYARSLARHGWDVSGIAACSDRDQAADALPAELLHELVVIGSAPECRARFARMSRSGLNPVVVPAGRPDQTERILGAFDPAL